MLTHLELVGFLSHSWGNESESGRAPSNSCSLFVYINISKCTGTTEGDYFKLPAIHQPGSKETFISAVSNYRWMLMWPWKVGNESKVSWKWFILVSGFGIARNTIAWLWDSKRQMHKHKNLRKRWKDWRTHMPEEVLFSFRLSLRLDLHWQGCWQVVADREEDECNYMTNQWKQVSFDNNLHALMCSHIGDRCKQRAIFGVMQACL